MFFFFFFRFVRVVPACCKHKRERQRKDERECVCVKSCKQEGKQGCAKMQVQACVGVGGTVVR